MSKGPTPEGVALSLLLVLAGCSVGPNYQRPSLAPVDGYPVPESEGDARQAQRFMTGQAPPRRWWTEFGSMALNRTVDQALQQNPTLSAANARLKMANEDLRAEKGGLWPNLSISRNQTQQKYSSVPGAPGTFYNVTTQSVSISYSFDLAGGERRAIEGKAAQSDYARYERAAAYQSLSANVVTAALDVAMLKEQIEASRDIVVNQQEIVSLIRGQWQAGAVAQEAILSAEARLDAQKIDLNTLSLSLAQAQHRLSILTGRTPAEGVAVDWTLADLILPQDLPLSLPSEVVEQRPDVLAHEALLHRASADVGVAEANMLPHITLDGSYSSSVWNLTNGLWQPIFARGRLSAQRKSAVAAYEAVGADYRVAVLGAFQDVADVLSALDNDNKTYASATDNLANARAGLALMEDRFGAGTISRVSLLTQRQAFQQARITSLQATADRYADTVALYQAMGVDDR